LTGPEPVVLPLDDPEIIYTYLIYIIYFLIKCELRRAGEPVVLPLACPRSRDAARDDPEIIFGIFSF
jgi:hypothetical protein